MRSGVTHCSWVFDAHVVGVLGRNLELNRHVECDSVANGILSMN